MQTFHHPLSPEEESHYLQKAKAGDLSARNILVEYNLRLVAHIVKKYLWGCCWARLKFSGYRWELHLCSSPVF